jgi:hypothetical protein
MTGGAILILDNISKLLDGVVRQPEKEVEVYKADGEVPVVARECLFE